MLFGKLNTFDVLKRKSTITNVLQNTDIKHQNALLTLFSLSLPANMQS